jgi:hypothetical protein
VRFRRFARFDALVATALVWFPGKFLRYAFPPLFGTIGTTYGVSRTVLGTAFTGLMLVYAAMQFPSGLFADRVGAVRVVTAGALVTAAAAFALGVVGVPGAVDVENRFGPVTDERTHVLTDLVVHNPNPTVLPVPRPSSCPSSTRSAAARPTRRLASLRSTVEPGAARDPNPIILPAGMRAAGGRCSASARTTATPARPNAPIAGPRATS